MKKIYLVSGLAITGVLAYFMFFRKKKGKVTQLPMTAEQKAEIKKLFGNKIEYEGNLEEKDTTKEEAQFFLDQYEELNKIYKQEIEKTKLHPLMNRDVKQKLQFENFIRTGEVPRGFSRVIFYKKLVSIKNDLKEVEQKINKLGYTKVGDTFVKSSNILTS